jgi:hypothetical protein
VSGTENYKYTTKHHITSHHITSYHITSHHLHAGELHAEQLQIRVRPDGGGREAKDSRVGVEAAGGAEGGLGGVEAKHRYLALLGEGAVVVCARRRAKRG